MNKKIVTLFLIAFTSGFLFCSSLFVFMEYDYEKSVLQSIVDKAKENTPHNNLTVLVDTLLSYTQQIQYPNTNIMFKGDYNFFKKIITPPSFSNFYFGEGVCGSYAAFFTRLMKYSGYKSYIVQMHMKNVNGAHMAVCILDSDKKYLVDPYFCHSFKDSNNHLSDINDVSNKWEEYYKKNVPDNYPQIYDYQNGWRFTNWDKLGAFSHGIYSALSKLGFKELDNFSYRYYIMGYNKYIALLLCIFSLLILGFGVKYFRKHFIISNAHTMPATARNSD